VIPNIASNAFLVLAVLVFVAVLLFLEAMYLLWKARHGAEARKVQERLKIFSGMRSRQLRSRLLRERTLSELPLAQRVLARISFMHSLDRFIMQSALEWTVGKLLLSCLALFAATWLIVREQWAPVLPLTVVAALLVGSLPLLFLAWTRHKRLRTLQRQLPDALDLMARALKAGHAFSAALKMAADEIADPTATELRIVHDEVNFGVSLQQALTHLSERVPLTDLRYFVVAVLIQRESGGNLTEILGSLSRLVRERLKLFARIRVLSSEGRLSAWVLGVMPFALAALLNIFNPKFMNVMWTDPIGVAITQYLLVLMAIGILVLIKIVKIRV
jgi:tight adherence protein B